MVERSAIDAVVAQYGNVLAGVQRVEPLGRGLINDTFAVEADAGAFVLQRLNPIFDPRIHENIEAVTRRLEHCGIPTPHLCRTDDEALWVEHDSGAWRLMTRLRGVSFDAVSDPAQAAAAAALLGRFHGALDGLDHTFVAMRSGVHDTPRHLQHLRDCLGQHRAHRLFPDVEPLAEAIFAAVDVLPAIDGVPDRAVHGDPKFNNILFEGPHPPADRQAVGLVDLDTVGPMPLHLEMGDAWRSWCNPRGEDESKATFDLAIFEASARSWASHRGFDLSAEEREGLLYGVDWITVELASRFLADALAESYFGFDASRYATRGEHNLVRARGQLALHEVVVACRQPRAEILGAAL
jgi:Ser/Thr protein kinase RdoA (MazF antagonist)